MFRQAWTYAVTYPDRLLEWTGQHLQIVLLANGIAVVVGILLGILESVHHLNPWRIA